MYDDSEEKRRERQHRRKIIAEWRAYAKTIRDADSNKKMLLREAKHESLARIEDAARSITDFENLNRIWDNQETVEAWRVDKHEKPVLDNMKDHELPEYNTVIPLPLAHIWWRSLMAGDFLDFIHDCPHELHELTANLEMHDFIKSLNEDKKEILYYRIIRKWSPQKLAVFRGQTDRNIRKRYKKILEDFRIHLDEKGAKEHE